MGAWIEINPCCCGGCFYLVAPYMGAWIEIRISRALFTERSVAPYMGAWIEMIVGAFTPSRNASLPTWERGLKSKSAEISRC